MAGSSEGSGRAPDAAAGSAGAAERLDGDVVRPSFAERARTLLHVRRSGALSTLSRRVAGFPFGSVAPYGVAPDGSPTFLFSTLAMHTQNLLADARASLLVARPAEDGDPLALERVTLVGEVSRANAADAGELRADYLGRHPGAAAWSGFGDFALYRMTVREIYFVAGFGSMGWVEAGAYAAAGPDPLSDVAGGVLAHMNADHADALVLYCRAFGGVAAETAEMTDVDRLGFGVRARVGGEERTLRIAFEREARTAEEARAVLVAMVRAARGRLSTA